MTEINAASDVQSLPQVEWEMQIINFTQIPFPT